MRIVGVFASLVLCALPLACAHGSKPAKTTAASLVTPDDGRTTIWVEHHLGDELQPTRVLLALDGALLSDTREPGSTLPGVMASLVLPPGEHTLSAMLVSTYACPVGPSEHAIVRLRDSYTFDVRPSPQKPPVIVIDFYVTSHSEVPSEGMHVRFDVTNQQPTESSGCYFGPSVTDSGCDGS